MDDRPIHQHIEDLSDEEERLYAAAGEGGGLSAPDRERLTAIKVELDQCFDLLHQREARRAAGLDPDAAEVRPADIVERYQQ
ncbi:MAG TPA: DUF2630 family protein [Candidatus Limnocylindrales bacterium]|jgi:hypothetical protein|nr:DUF2630 family protein [Candidatus Limnocylindrales bacterium]